MGHVAVDVHAVVEQVMLMTGLGAVVGECPIDEIVGHTDESDVIVDGAVMIGRPQQRAVGAIDPARVALHAVVDVGPVGEPLDLVA